MNELREIQYFNTLKKIEERLDDLSLDFGLLLTQEVQVNEQDEDMLNKILNDAERRIEAAKRGLSAASKITDPVERKQHVGRMLGHLNRTRTLLDRVVKEFFPVDNIDDKNFPSANPDEFISPQQAAQTLGIHPTKIQDLVQSGKLRMYNDNGRWALKGSDVQNLVDGGEGSKRPDASHTEPSARGSRFGNLINRFRR